MTLSPCDTTPAQNKLSRHHHDMAWHHMTWKRHSARHGMTWHGITLLDINTWHDMWHLMTWHPSALTIPRQHKTSCGIIMTWHDMTWNHIAWYHYLTWPMMTWQDKARHYSYGIFHTHTLSSHSIWANMYHRSLRSLTTSRPWWRSQQTSNFQPEVAVTWHKPSFDIINQVLT